MIVQSLRFRLQLWHGALLVIVLSGFGATAYRTASIDQTRRINDELEFRLENLFRPPPEELRGLQPPPGMQMGMPPPPHDVRMWLGRMLRSRVEQLAAESGSQYYYVAYDENGVATVKTPNTPAALPKRGRPAGAPPRRVFAGPGPPGPLTPREYGIYRDVLRELPHGEAVAVGRSIETDRAELRRLAVSFLAAGAALLVFGLAGGWLLASRAIRPISAISETASKIAAGDLSQRIAVRETASELGQMAQVLNSTFQRLQSAFDRQSRFTSDASHELRTPISVLLSQIQLTLSRDRTTKEYRDALLACQRAAQRMRRLTESLLALARLDAGEEPIHRERFDLTALVRDCIELSRPLAWENEIEFVCELPPVECVGDEDRLAQVVLNLAANAINFNARGGRVRVAAKRRENAAELTVSDTGPGISYEDLPHIFERFYRADRSRSKSQGSSGLGLSICHSIVEAHGGTIAVTSVVGEGTTFIVTLPDTPPAR
ncbi:MAG: HAMP domain-containing protein, partial [Acidobacteria bacterium]|nr:HAMP domain-containing protein [Acidobacteriota bacterium]